MISLKRWRALLGIGPAAAGHRERLLSALGGMTAILAVFTITARVLPGDASHWVVASMGASAVLLFAVPHGKLSQPWAVAGGHLVSGAVGILCASLVPDPALAAALAVGGAIAAMYYLRCIHPPGGATALTAVIGGPAVEHLGWSFLVMPLALNVAVILSTAALFNFPLPWRRYPVALVYPEPEERAEPADVIDEADLTYAMRELDSYVDVTAGDLQHIYELAQRHARERRLHPEAVSPGSSYCNGRFGDEWSVRHVVDAKGEPDPDRDQIIYRVVAGAGRRSSGVCTRSEFAQWAGYEVFRNESSWLRARPQQAEAGGEEQVPLVPAKGFSQG